MKQGQYKNVTFKDCKCKIKVYLRISEVQVATKNDNFVFWNFAGFLEGNSHLPLSFGPKLTSALQVGGQQVHFNGLDLGLIE